MAVRTHQTPLIWFFKLTQTWKKRPEAGTRWAIGFFTRVILFTGRPLARLLLAPICGYFLLVRGYERKASREFLNTALGRPAKFIDVARHFWTFSQVVLDRVFLLAKGRSGFELNCEGFDKLHKGLDQGRGCLLLGSHLGSFEANRIVSFDRPDVKVYVLMDRTQGSNAIEIFEMLSPELAEQVIDSSQHRGALALRIAEVLQQGHIVALLGDRVTDNEQVAEVNFLEHKTELPVSPYLLSAVTKAPIILFFSLFEGGNCYRIVFEEFDAAGLMYRAKRQQQLQVTVQNYANRLAYHAKISPYNWFNFYPFFKSD